jgi:hypothetical protein
VRHRAGATALLLALGLLPFFGLARYNYPFWDDFGMAMMVRKYGFWEAQRVFYTTWGGRYSTAFVQTVANPLSYGWLAGTQVTTLLLLAGTLLALYLALRELSGGQLARPAAGRGAALLLLLCLAWMPTVYPMFYWFASGTGYQLGIVLMLLILVAGLRAQRAVSPGCRWAWYGLAQLSTVLVVGLNEIAMLLLGWTLLVALASSARAARSRAAACWGGLLATAVAGGTVAVLGPGNWVRLYGPAGARLPHPPVHIFTVLRYATEYSSAFLARPGHLLALLLVALLLGPLLVRLRHARPSGFRLPLGVGVAVLLVGVGLSFLFFALVSQNPPPGRTQSFIWQWVFLGWVGVLWAALPAQVPAVVRRALGHLQRAAMLLTMFLLAVGIERSAWTEWLRNAPTWGAQNEARFRQLRQAARQGQRDVAVPPFSGIAPRHVSIMGENLFPNPAPNNSVQRSNNDAVAQWFGLRSVTLTAPSQQGQVGPGL